MVLRSRRDHFPSSRQLEDGDEAAGNSRPPFQVAERVVGFHDRQTTGELDLLAFRRYAGSWIPGCPSLPLSTVRHASISAV